MATTTKTAFHAIATSQVLQSSQKYEAITITNNSAADVWAGTDSRVAIWPWYGTRVSMNQTLTLQTVPGQSVYSSAPSGAAVLTITIT